MREKKNIEISRADKTGSSSSSFSSTHFPYYIIYKYIQKSSSACARLQSIFRYTHIYILCYNTDSTADSHMYIYRYTHTEVHYRVDTPAAAPGLHLPSFPTLPSVVYTSLSSSFPLICREEEGGGGGRDRLDALVAGHRSNTRRYLPGFFSRGPCIYIASAFLAKRTDAFSKCVLCVYMRVTEVPGIYTYSVFSFHPPAVKATSCSPPRFVIFVRSQGDMCGRERRSRRRMRRRKEKNDRTRFCPEKCFLYMRVYNNISPVGIVSIHRIYPRFYSVGFSRCINMRVYKWNFREKRKMKSVSRNSCGKLHIFFYQ